jgi:hypothetical protein
MGKFHEKLKIYSEISMVALQETFKTSTAILTFHALNSTKKLL